MRLNYMQCAYNGGRMPDKSFLDALPPLQPTSFHILLSLADEDRHGYAIIQDIARRTNGDIKLSAGTLYRSIQRLQEQGLIVGDQDPSRARRRR